MPDRVPLGDGPGRRGDGVRELPLGGVAPDFRPQAQLSDRVAAYVRELIMSGQLRQGEFIRLEKLAAEIGVSATPVREALLALRGEGFVQLVPRRGFVVAPLSRQDVEDLYFVQAQLAGRLAARTAVKMTSDDLAAIEKIQAELEEAADTGEVEDLEKINFQFHRRINLLADSPKLAWFLGQAARYAPRQFYGSIHGWRQASLHDHRAIVEALRARSARGAEATMQAHITHAGALLVQHLEQGHLWE